MDPLMNLVELFLLNITIHYICHLTLLFVLCKSDAKDISYDCFYNSQKFISRSARVDRESYFKNIKMFFFVRECNTTFVKL